MQESYRTVYSGGEGEIIEKKSRFIATIRHVETEEDTMAFLEEMKKKYWDARHNCYAYTLGTRQEISRCSDDGEPSGTAGRPMLEVLNGEKLCNTMVVVTRYFGGVLLGTGGLVRAYGQAVKAGIEKSLVIEKIRGIALSVMTDYNGIGKLQYLANEHDLAVLDTEYTERVVLRLLVPSGQEQLVRKLITESTSGRAQMEKEKDLWFAIINGKPEIFES